MRLGYWKRTEELFEKDQRDSLNWSRKSVKRNQLVDTKRFCSEIMFQKVLVVLGEGGQWSGGGVPEKLPYR